MTKKVWMTMTTLTCALCLSASVLADAEGFALRQTRVQAGGKTEETAAIFYGGEIYLSGTDIQKYTGSSAVYQADTNTVNIGAATTSAAVQRPKPVGTEAQTGTAFSFDYLAITLGSQCQWAAVDNSYSALDGDAVFKLPVKVENISRKNHRLNRSNLTIYNPQGIELEEVNSYFSDSFSKSGSIKPEMYVDSSLYGLYDGPGVYTIEFDNGYEQKIIKMDIRK